MAFFEFFFSVIIIPDCLVLHTKSKWFMVLMLFLVHKRKVMKLIFGKI